jgi:RpiB/LacA/LacB family sugar-phosphate isomerase
MIDDLGSHVGKPIVFGHDRHVVPELEAYTRALASHGPVEPAVDASRLHYLTSAERVCRRLAVPPAGVGVLICLTGMGVCIAANKFFGIYAARCLGVEDARAARTVNNANVLCLAVTSGFALNQDIIAAFMTTPYEGRKLDELVYLRWLEMGRVTGGRGAAAARAAASTAWPTSHHEPPGSWDEPVSCEPPATDRPGRR